MKEYKRHSMVDWYLPSQLIRTGIKTLVSTDLAASIDTRRLQAGDGNDDECIIDYSEQNELSFDYMADTGDGWNSTYTLAYLLTRPKIKVGNTTLERADILIMGGDEVYPVASETHYQERLINPFKKAAEDIDLSRITKTDVYLVPGNHDWYDSLGSFSKKFFAYKRGDGSIKQREPFKQFKNRQLRSYFVLKLPSNWEIWSLDIQLGKDIDVQQFNFFNDHSQKISADTKIIICTAEPEYVYGEQATGDLAFAINRISRLAYNKGAKIKLQLAGDVHNYQRYAIPKKDKNTQNYTRQYIISGGGGAFLHPTHGFNQGSEEKPKFEPVKRYPDQEVSQKLTGSLLTFAFQHKGMSAFIGALYVTFFWAIGPNLEAFSSNIWETILLYPIEHVGSFLLMVIVFFGCFAFASAGGAGATNKCWGAIHWLSHIGMAIISWNLGNTVTQQILSNNMPILAIYLPILMTFLIGGMLGGTLFGFYLHISLNYFRIHHNETFSALACPDYKNFLRCKIHQNGSLEISVIGIDKSASDESEHPVKTHLIERITIT